MNTATDAPAGASSDPAAPVNSLLISSVRNAMQVMEVVAASPEPIGLTRIAALSGLGKSATQRLTHTLHDLGYLDKDPVTRRYQLSVKVLDFAYGFLSKDALINGAMLLLMDARERLGQGVNMGRLDGTDFIYTVRMPGHRLSVIGGLIGRRQPAYCTSGGHAILSLMPRASVEALLDARPLKAMTPMTVTDRARLLELIDQARQEGFSVTNQQILIGELAVAAPIVDGYGLPIGAVQCSVSTADWSFDRVRAELAPQVLQTANRISRVPASHGG